MDINDAQLHRDPQLYFPDGDLVLRAIGSGGRIHLLRIHKFLLKHNSIAFKDMFSAEDGSCSDTYDGVPVVDMHGDRAEDLALLVSYLYYPSQLSFKRLDPDKLKVSGVVRLADKYLLESLQKHLIQQVISDWPTTLQEWDIRDAEIQAIRKAADADTTSKARKELVPEPVAAILFAEEFGCRQILPAAFYQLAQTKLSHNWDDEGIKRDPWMESLPLARWSLLEKENLVRCLQIFQALDDYRVDATALMSEKCLCFLSWVMDEEGYAEATRSYQCLAFMGELVTVVWRRNSRKNPLKLLLELLEYEQYPALSKERFPNGLCEHCRERLPEAVNQRRETLWKSLPDHFMVQMNLQKTTHDLYAD